MLPTIEYSHFHEWLDALSDGPTGLTGVPTVMGERPNIWIYECTPTHHWLFSSFRDAGRLLPAAEAFAAFFSLVSRDHFASYPEATLDTAWLNLTLDDHGIAPEVAPKGQGLPDWFINDNSPDHWDEVRGLLSRMGSLCGRSVACHFCPFFPRRYTPISTLEQGTLVQLCWRRRRHRLLRSSTRRWPRRAPWRLSSCLTHSRGLEMIPCSASCLPLAARRK